MTFPAKNEIEKLLIRAQANEIDHDTFMGELMDTKVFLPVLEKKDSLRSPDEIMPLMLKDPSGTEVLILFTSPERAKEFVKGYAGYNGGFLAEFKWILEQLGTGYAISINPDHDIGFDLEAVMVQKITQH